MPAITTYTESELKAYLHDCVGGFADFLSFSVGAGSYDRTVNKALSRYGVETIDLVDGVTEAALLEACARYELWTSITNKTNAYFSLSSKGDSLSLGQLNEHARKSATEAWDDVIRLRNDLDREGAEADGGSGDMVIYDVSRDDDPYEALAALEAENQEYATEESE